VIHHDGSPTIIDTLLTFILKMGKKVFNFHFCLSRQPIISFWQCATCCPPDYTSYMTNNRWRSVDGHFHAGARRVLQSVFPIKAANSSFMTDCSLSEVWFPWTHEQKSLTLHWPSFLWWCREGIVTCFAYTGSQKFLYDWLQPIGGVISQDSWPKIIDAPFTLIILMGQGGQCNLFCL